jgi:hypothetical protein
MSGKSEQPQGQIVRPIHWNRRLRTDEAQREIKRRLDIADPIITDHAYDRIKERGDERLLDSDVLTILRQGTVRQQPRKEENGWSVTVERRMPGSREAGVVTVIVHPGDDLNVITVEWMDWLLR